MADQENGRRLCLPLRMNHGLHHPLLTILFQDQQGNQQDGCERSPGVGYF